MLRAESENSALGLPILPAASPWAELGALGQNFPILPSRPYSITPILTGQDWVFLPAAAEPYGARPIIGMEIPARFLFSGKMRHLMGMAFGFSLSGLSAAVR